MADILPKSVRSRKKHPFAVPIAEWLRNELKDYARDILLSKTSIDRGYFNPARVEEIVDEHQTGKKDHSFRIWSLLNLELWHRIYIDKPQILSSA
jgi:asparagine synthase (glutamine-hydrolysing)